jgi:hypothetical protein
MLCCMLSPSLRLLKGLLPSSLRSWQGLEVSGTSCKVSVQVFLASPCLYLIPVSRRCPWAILFLLLASTRLCGVGKVLPSCDRGEWTVWFLEELEMPVCFPHQNQNWPYSRYLPIRYKSSASSKSLNIGNVCFPGIPLKASTLRVRSAFTLDFFYCIDQSLCYLHFLY